MDPQFLQQLAQIFQQGLTLTQQAMQQGGGGMMPPDGDGDEGPGAGMMPPGAPGGDGDEDDPNGMGAPDGDGMGGDGSLHDRVSALEDHTGLAKTAGERPGTMGDRLDFLEDEILGQQFDGPMLLRVQQLEKALGTVPDLADSAPDEIPLEALIKSAAAQAARAAVAEMAGNSGGQLPSPQSMRKTAGRGHIGERKAQQPLIRTDEQLVKAAQTWGLSDGDLDAPVSFGDVLQMQYEANKAGVAFPLDDDD
ncbi:MAG: hypothetical protein O3A14_11410 [Cyanobacteria bacterium]|nr:hypothetical protein [Cyanobacteriota bacterium]